ncbi:MAG: prolipoprotein diacylglyceryl transferase, partial [bacterium]|nr:prolipoprotein diacylglyceryl transferase [bacterium]
PMAVHPTQLYESGANIILFLFLVRMRPRFPGEIFFAYLIGYSIIRFFIDFARGDSPEVLFSLKLTQFISLATIIIAIFFIPRCRKKYCSGQQSAISLKCYR